MELETVVWSENLKRNRYPIPAGEARAEIRVSNSRFFATAAYTPSVADARAFVVRIKREFADATHNVSAYVVAYGATTTLGVSDDGEPGGTAGRPALAVLRGSGLGDAAVVVTRYFGGTLLGTGGLVRAYSEAVRAVLEVLPRAEKIERRLVRTAVEYGSYEKVRRLAEQHGAELVDEQFAAIVTLQLRFAVDALPLFEQGLRELTAGRARLESPAEE